MGILFAYFYTIVVFIIVVMIIQEVYFSGYYEPKNNIGIIIIMPILYVLWNLVVYIGLH